MLTSIGRTAIRRVGRGATKSWGAPVYQRILQSLRDDSMNTTSNSLLQPQLSYSAQRSFATANTATKTSKPSTAATPKTKTTTTRAKKATTKTIKKAAAKKPAKKTIKKVAKKKVVKKAAKRKPRAKKPLTEEKKLKVEETKKRAELRELKEAALKKPNGAPRSAWGVVLQEVVVKGDKTPFAELSKQAAAKYKSLTPAELEAYNHTANQNKAAWEKNYKSWIESHTPDQIRKANNARNALQRITGVVSKYSRIVDPRVPKKARSPLNLFTEDRWATGDMKGIAISESGKLLSKEWSNLSSSEKQAYADRAEADKQRYVQQYQSVFHRDPEFLKASPA